MRLARRNAALLGLVLLLALVRWASSAARPLPAPARPWLADLDPARVATMRVTCGASALELARQGELWSVPARGGFPADARVVDELLRRLAALTSADLVSIEPSARERFGLGDGARRLVLGADGGAPLAELLVGRAAEPDPGVYLRRAGADEVVRSATLALPDCEPSRWLEARLLDVSPAEVRRLRATLGARALALVRLPDGRWQEEGGTRTIPATRVDPLLLVLGNLFLADVRDVAPASAGLAPPAASIELGMDEGRALALHLGSALPGGGRAATRPDWPSPWIVELPARSAARVEDALARLLEDLAAAR